MTNSTLRALVAEPAPGKAAAALQSYYANSPGQLILTSVSTAETLLQSLPGTSPELVLLDLALVQPDPANRVRRICRSCPGVPVIVVTDLSGKQIAKQCVSEGAMDYLMREFLDSHELDRVLQAAFKRNTMEGLTDLLRDSVTGLYNREGFLTHGAQARFLGKSTGELVLLLAYVDNLPELRAESSTLADRALRETAQILVASFRRSDIIARAGDAHFAVLGTDAPAPTAVLLLQRVAKHFALRNKTVHEVNPGARNLDVRLQVAAWNITEDPSFEQFLDSVESGLRQMPPSSVLVPECVG